MAWYTPSLKVRKLRSGTSCPGCSLLMHWGDMVAFSMPGQTIYLHDKCAEVLLTQPDEDAVIQEEIPVAAEETN